jgi:hypothetical protein
MPTPLNPLTERQTNICNYGGAFGILLSVTCLIQHLVVTRSTWVSQVMVSLYFFAIMAFLLLALLKHYAHILLIISSVFAIIMQYLWMREAAFSLTVTMLFMYHVIILVILFTEQVPQKLKQKKQLQKAEEAEWMGKL